MSRLGCDDDSTNAIKLWKYVLDLHSFDKYLPRGSPIEGWMSLAQLVKQFLGGTIAIIWCWSEELLAALYSLHGDG